MAAMKLVGEQIKKIDDELRGIEENLTDLNLRIPNLPHVSVPVGKDSSGNKEERRWGSPPALTAPPRTIGISAKSLAFWISTVQRNLWRTICRPDGGRSQARTGPHQLYVRPSYDTAWVSGSSASTPRQSV